MSVFGGNRAKSHNVVIINQQHSVSVSVILRLNNHAHKSKKSAKTNKQFLRIVPQSRVSSFVSVFGGNRAKSHNVGIINQQHSVSVSVILRLNNHAHKSKKSAKTNKQFLRIF